MTEQTVKIGRITYTVEHEVTEGFAITQLGWLVGPRGDLAAVIRTERGTLMAMGSRTLDRVANATVHAALLPVFGTPTAKQDEPA